MPTPTPQNTNFEAAVRAVFDGQVMMQTLGARLTRIAPGEVDIEFPYSAAFAQQHGYLHAGAIATVADTACGAAAFTFAPPGAGVLAVEFKINLMAPARAPWFVAEARVLRAGKTLSTCFAEVYGVTGEERELVATMLSTIIVRTIGGQRPL